MLFSLKQKVIYGVPISELQFVLTVDILVIVKKRCFVKVGDTLTTQTL